MFSVWKSTTGRNTTYDTTPHTTSTSIGSTSSLKINGNEEGSRLDGIVCSLGFFELKNK
jgi:hypothetical protein